MSIKKRGRKGSDDHFYTSSYGQSLSSNNPFKSPSSSSNGHDEEVCTFEPEAGDRTDFFSNLRRFYEEGSLTDVSFNARGKIFRVHRVVLSANSGYLSAMMCSGMQESLMEVIDIDEDPTLFKCLLDFLYGLSIHISSSAIVPLLGLAAKFSMVSLRDQLASKLESNTNVENCCLVLAAAEAFGCKELREQARQRIFSNFASVAKTTAFYDLPFQLIHSICSSDDILDCDEAIVFSAIVRWLEHSHSHSASAYNKCINNDNSSIFSQPCDTNNNISSSNSNSSSGSNNNYSISKSNGKSITSSIDADYDRLVTSLLETVRFPLLDSCYLSDVIKRHPLMQSPARACMLMEAWEHHALKAAGRNGVISDRCKPRSQSCSFSQSTMLQGHADAVSTLLAYQDWLISGSWDNSIKVWTTDTWLCIRTLSDHTGPIRGLALCNDKVVSCSEDGSVKVWTPGSWTCVRSMHSEDQAAAVNAVVQCQSRLASAGDDGLIRLWNTSCWSCEVTVHQSNGVEMGSTASIGRRGGREDRTADGRLVGAVDDQDRADGDEEEDDEATREVGVMSLEVMGDKLISGSDDFLVRIWNTSSWTCEAVLRAHQDEIWSLRATANNKLVTGSVDGTLCCWRRVDATSSSSNLTAQLSSSATTSIFASPALSVEMQSSLVTPEQNRMRTYSINEDLSPAAIRSVMQTTGCIDDAPNSGDSHELALRSSERREYANSSNGWVLEHRVASTSSSSSSMSAASSSSSSSSIMQTSDDTSVIVDDTSISYSQAMGPVYALCCMNGRIVSAGAGSRIAVWGADWQLQRCFDTSEGGVWSLAVCKGKLVSGGMDGTIRVWV